MTRSEERRVGKRVGLGGRRMIAEKESIYHPSHFWEYLQRGACSIVQADVARIGGITPWLKVAHLAEFFFSSRRRHTISVFGIPAEPLFRSIMFSVNSAPSMMRQPL